MNDSDILTARRLLFLRGMMQKGNPIYRRKTYAAQKEWAATRGYIVHRPNEDSWEITPEGRKRVAEHPRSLK